jgi:hypothetical protein
MTHKLPSPEGDRETHTTDLVRRAVLQLKAFGDLNRGQVRHLLPYWRHFVSLSPAEMLAVVDRFPPGEDNAQARVMPGRMIGSDQ